MKILSILLFIFITSLHASTAFSQSAMLKGVVTTSDGKPAPYVSLTIKESGKTIVVGDDGTFALSTPACTCTIQVSYVGLKTQEKKISLRDGEVAELNFTLSENANELKEVIVSSVRTLNRKEISAGKVAINPMDLPQSISVIGKKIISDQQALRLSDVIRNVNGVYLATTRASTQESFSARGYSFSSSNMFKNGSRVHSGAIYSINPIAPRQFATTISYKF